MNAPQKGVEVDLKELGCPYDALDPRTAIWLDGYSKGYRGAAARGAEIVRETYDEVFGTKK